MPPGETTPSINEDAATPPIGKPYPWCMSGMTTNDPHKPGNMEELIACSMERSASDCCSKSWVLNIFTVTCMPFRNSLGNTHSYSFFLLKSFNLIIFHTSQNL